ncbi:MULTISPECIES: TraH family protein [Rhizobium]|uniref:Conjugal transfer protein TraH n=1 Tax=Rhizobium esperanzae TaxID=1967781 RepID=A0A2D0AAG7_9HYPH|nr:MULTISPECIES: TraH family protein [Rhizobium]OWO91530.1 conjugal transfer protein TraH [Rhizobium esperanzae]PCK83792.1 conjugal transfer protein TraH [Rhizobium sophoriradicis]PDS72818.1 conjugal transfer protein TraH [Rhizobium sp. L43]ULJ82474.1 conjugal transfer protein TraH [Rhizobium sp. C104]
MLDAAQIKDCADPSLTPAIVEQFVTAAGSADPLAVTVRSGGRLILVPKAKSPDEAMDIVRQYTGKAVVRVGLTQFPAGVGVKDLADLKPDLIDACQNLRKGTAMFAKIIRIVAKWYGNPKSDDVFPQIFEDSVYAWKTGVFEGVGVFQADDPGGAIINQTELKDGGETEFVDEATPSQTDAEPQELEEVGKAGMRIDLSRIGGQKGL